MAAAIVERVCGANVLPNIAGRERHISQSKERRQHSFGGLHQRGLKRSFVGSSTPKQRNHRLLVTRRGSVQCSAAGAASGGAAEEDPYTVLGINRLASSDDIMSARRRRVKDAEKRMDTAAQERIEKAYDSIMYGQLNKRASGMAFGNVEVSKDIKYADRQPLTPKWWPKKAPVNRKNMLINAAVAGILILETAAMKEPNADKLPLVLIAMIFRLYFKLGEFYTYEDEDLAGKSKARTQLLLRVLGLSFGTFIFAGMFSSIAASALSYPPALVVNTVVVASVLYVVSFLR